MIWWIPFPRYLPHAAAIWLTHDDRSFCPTTAGATGNPGVPRREPPCRKPPAGAGSLLRAANRGTVAHRKSETNSSHFYARYKNQTHLILWGLFGKPADTEMAGKKKEVTKQRAKARSSGLPALGGVHQRGNLQASYSLPKTTLVPGDSREVSMTPLL